MTPIQVVLIVSVFNVYLNLNVVGDSNFTRSPVGHTTPSTELSWSVAEVGYVLEKDSLLKNFNDHRRKIAKENNVSDMYELEWKNDTEGSLRSFYAAPRDQDTSDAMKEQFKNYYTGRENVTEDQSHSLGLIEVLNIRQKFVNCYEFNVIPLYLLKCYLGPEEDFIASWSKGEPGSNCTAGYSNHDGLCRRGAPTKAPFKPTQPPPVPTKPPVNDPPPPPYLLKDFKEEEQPTTVKIEFSTSKAKNLSLGIFWVLGVLMWFNG